MLSPGATIGIIGGGQLGRMTALAAYRLGYRCHVFTADAQSPGAQVTNAVTVAELDDANAIRRFADKVDLVTYETENVPYDALQAIEGVKPIRPGLDVLRVTQDRLKEKDYLRSIDVDTAPYREITSAAALARALRDHPGRSVLKTVRMGYDGKGQVAVGPDSDAEKAWAQMGGPLGILEGHIDFHWEVSVIVARGENGAIVNYPAVENQHANHILDATIVPARVSPEATMRAEAIARHIAERLGVIGLLAVEMFVTDNDHILVNELAPRPHNSGHWTIDACYTSQFEQFVRALAGLPFGSTERHSDAVMRNIMGAEVDNWRDHVNDAMVKLHLYGKDQALPGRKMGHVTRLIPRW